MFGENEYPEPAADCMPAIVSYKREQNCKTILLSGFGPYLLLGALSFFSVLGPIFCAFGLVIGCCLF